MLRHPWQTVLMILGISLGVAVVIAVDVANASASRAFDLSTEIVAGKATHQIIGGPQGLDEMLYTRLRAQSAQYPMAPVLTTYVSSPQLGNIPLQLLGLDPFAEPPFRNYLNPSLAPQDRLDSPLASANSQSLTAFLTQPGVVLISANLAERFSLIKGQALILEIGGKVQTVQVADFVQAPLTSSSAPDRLSQQALDGLILADIATAQELTGRLGMLDRIDIILPERAEALPGLQALLPPGVFVQPVAARSGTVEQMTAAFRTNLTALSLLALGVGLFLIYNTITFSVVQRRPLFGILRALGVTRGEVFSLVLSEALVVGILGASLGAALGVLLGQGAIRLVTQTINDLFFVVTVQGVSAPASSLVKGCLLGVFATLAAAAPPAWEAAATPPRLALSRSGLESKAQKAIGLAALAGLLLLALGLVLLGAPPGLTTAAQSLVLSFTATFLIVVGLALQVPLATRLLMQLAVPVFGRIWGSLGRMAPRDVVNSLSRTAIASMALMVAVSVTIGVSVMISSFRSTVISWLADTLQGDIYISAPGLSATTPSIPLEPSAIQSIRLAPGIDQVYLLRAVTVSSPAGPVNLAATDNQNVALERVFLSSTAPAAEMWGLLANGAVLVSEPFANRQGLALPGASVTLDTDQGPRTFPVAGIYYDYASPQGTVLIDLAIYRRYWNDPAVTAMAVITNPATDLDQLVRELQARVETIQRLEIRPNQVLRDEVLSVFDRTFAITSALQLLATLVAFIGVLSALLSLELERQRELGILRSVGLTIRQLWTLILTETGLMGGIAGLLAMPTGYILALILVYIINRRSFGWTLQMQVDPAPFIQALLIALLAALLAGIYPAWRMSRMLTAEALRSE